MFLSIGYSTCHWCHVMAHESFENEHIAAHLNTVCVPVKVDREELPGVDAVYMEFVQKTTGSGGWPLSVFLTPEGKPFFGGTYFPPTDQYGRRGFESLLNLVDEAWRNRRDELLKSADDIAAMMQPPSTAVGPLSLDQSVLTDAAAVLKRIHDPEYGGFGSEPKFPQPSMLSFLLTVYRRTGDKDLLTMVENTLIKMDAGGIHDHLGGGFHRYSVDRQWLVPHFEKMLYDQALIARAAVQAYQLTGHAQYRRIACDIFDYVLRDMSDPAGGFYAAEDADSEGVEGRFYVWTPDQLDPVLSPQEQQLIRAYYNVSDTGNFEDGWSILNVTLPLSAAARECGLNLDQAQTLLETARKKLFSARRQRIRPHRDEKIIAGWNGLMIAALAAGGAVFEMPAYIDAANRSADFILVRLLPTGRLRRYFGKGQPRQKAVLNDYAFLLRGLIELYQADFNPLRLCQARDLAAQMVELFEDPDAGGFYLTGSDVPERLARTRPDFDGAVPGGCSVVAAELLRLAELTGDKQWIAPAEKTLAFYQDNLQQQGAALTEMLTAVDLWLGPRSEIVIAAPGERSQSRDIIKLLHHRFLPRTVLLLRDAQTDGKLLEKVAGPAKDRRPVQDQPTVYLCENFTCRRPLTDLSEIAEAVENLP